MYDLYFLSFIGKLYRIFGLIDQVGIGRRRRNLLHIVASKIQVGKVQHSVFDHTLGHQFILFIKSSALAVWMLDRLCRIQAVNGAV